MQRRTVVIRGRDYACRVKQHKIHCAPWPLSLLNYSMTQSLTSPPVFDTTLCMRMSRTDSCHIHGFCPQGQQYYLLCKLMACIKVDFSGFAIDIRVLHTFQKTEPVSWMLRESNNHKKFIWFIHLHNTNNKNSKQQVWDCWHFWDHFTNLYKFGNIILSFNIFSNAFYVIYYNIWWCF